MSRHPTYDLTLCLVQGNSRYISSRVLTNQTSLYRYTGVVQPSTVSRRFPILAYALCVSQHYQAQHHLQFLVVALLAGGLHFTLKLCQYPLDSSRCTATSPSFGDASKLDPLKSTYAKAIGVIAGSLWVVLVSTSSVAWLWFCKTFTQQLYGD